MNVVIGRAPKELDPHTVVAASLDPLPCCRGEAAAVLLDRHLSGRPRAELAAAVAAAADLLAPGGVLSVLDLDLYRVAAAVCDGADPAAADRWVAGRGCLPTLAEVADAATSCGLIVTLKALSGVEFALTAERP